MATTTTTTTTTMLLAAAALAATLAVPRGVAADIYMHNPRGSNDRNGEGNANRQNAQRLFDSENNAAGGYGIGAPMAYYEGSWLTVEWTNQHSCGNDNSHCEIILQYMCGTKDAVDEEAIRDGTTTTTISENTPHAKSGSGTAFLYGMHETQSVWDECKARKRNMGLYIADRNLNGNTAAYTRQNNNGQRHGFECAEERDYYPYWHPSPWKDIAVFTTDTSRCSYYRSESQNVQPKGHCVNDESPAAHKTASAQNNAADCEKDGGKGARWAVDSAHGIAPPECLKAPWSRDNHLGNGVTDTLAGNMAHYNWSLPTGAAEPCVALDNCVCVLRLRYNISTADYVGWPDQPGFADAAANSKDEKEALVKQDPYVKIAGKPLSLALNTNQYGRTFQDRSHTFTIRPRPPGLAFGQRIFNLNVRGKRGNIVQTYPSVEYDFVPTHLVVRHLDFVHPQWTGFDENAKNGNNNAEGAAGTDRSNLVQIASMNDNVPKLDSNVDFAYANVEPLFSISQQRHHFAHLGQDGCKSIADLPSNQGQADADAKNCMKLNAASAYFDGGLHRMNATGQFYYMSTRNNNYSNRSQKGSLTVMPILNTWSAIVAGAGGAMCLATLGVAALAVHAKRNPMSRAAQYMSRV